MRRTAPSSSRPHTHAHTCHTHTPSLSDPPRAGGRANDALPAYRAAHGQALAGAHHLRREGQVSASLAGALGARTTFAPVPGGRRHVTRRPSALGRERSVQSTPPTETESGCTSVIGPRRADPGRPQRARGRAAVRTRKRLAPMTVSVSPPSVAQPAVPLSVLCAQDGCVTATHGDDSGRIRRSTSAQPRSFEMTGALCHAAPQFSSPRSDDGGGPRSHLG